MKSRRHARVWARALAAATLLCVLQAPEISADENIRSGQRSHRLQPEENDIFEAFKPVRAHTRILD